MAREVIRLYSNDRLEDVFVNPGTTVLHIDPLKYRPEGDIEVVNVGDDRPLVIKMPGSKIAATIVPRSHLKHSVIIGIPSQPGSAIVIDQTTNPNISFEPDDPNAS